MRDNINSGLFVLIFLYSFGVCVCVCVCGEHKKVQRWSDEGRHWCPQALELKFSWSCDYDSPSHDPRERKEEKKTTPQHRRRDCICSCVLVCTSFCALRVVWVPMQCVCLWVCVRVCACVAPSPSYSIKSLSSLVADLHHYLSNG